MGAVLMGVLFVSAQGGDVKILAQAAWPFARPDPKNVGVGARLIVIRSDAELLRATGLPGDGRSRMQLAAYVTKAFGKDKIDFDKQMLVVITGGTRPSGGFKVEATKVTSDGKTLTIHWKLHAPDGPASAVLTHPAIAVLLDRFPGEIRADPPAAGTKKNDKQPNK